MSAPRLSSSNRARSRGFTLIELMLALVAGMAVAYAAFLMSKNATRFFQHESRISTTQLSVTLGASRLATDIQRAGFLSTPNIQSDPAVCRGEDLLSTDLAKLAAIQIEPTNLDDVPQSKDADLKPQDIIIAGAFDTTEQFPVRAIINDPAGLIIMLQRDSGAMARTGVSNIPSIFAAGRVLRIVDAEGRHEYGVIAKTPEAHGTGTDLTYQIQLAKSPSIPIRTSDASCGISPGFNTGVLVNPVSRIRYRLRSLAADTEYQALVAPMAAGLSGDEGRTELVREELDVKGNVMSTELVAEFAVDLRFGLTSVAAATPNIATTLGLTDAEADAVLALAGDVSTTPGAAPQRVRSVQLRFTARTRAPDRATALPVADDGRVARLKIDVSGAEQYFRARSLYTTVELPNLRGAVW